VCDVRFVFPFEPADRKEKNQRASHQEHRCATASRPLPSSQRASPPSSASPPGRVRTRGPDHWAHLACSTRRNPASSAAEPHSSTPRLESHGMPRERSGGPRAFTCSRTSASEPPCASDLSRPRADLCWRFRAGIDAKLTIEQWAGETLFRNHPGDSCSGPGVAWPTTACCGRLAWRVHARRPPEPGRNAYCDLIRRRSIILSRTGGQFERTAPPR
jgi:hypothetical protein